MKMVNTLAAGLNVGRLARAACFLREWTRKAAASWLWTPTGSIVPPPGTFIDANFRLQASTTAGQ